MPGFQQLPNVWMPGQHLLGGFSFGLNFLHYGYKKNLGISSDTKGLKKNTLLAAAPLSFELKIIISFNIQKSNFYPPYDYFSFALPIFLFFFSLFILFIFQIYSSYFIVL